MNSHRVWVRRLYWTLSGAQFLLWAMPRWLAELAWDRARGRDYE